MPTFPLLDALTITSLLLVLNLIFLWMASGMARQRSKQTPNPEDARLFHMEQAEENPPGVARVLRAHGNAQAAILPFLLLGLLAVLYDTGTGMSHAVALGAFVVFTAARWLHSFCYLAQRQPARLICFLVGLAAQLALMGDLVYFLAVS